MKTKDLTLCALMLALLAVFSQFAIPIGPIAITLQTFVVYLIGSLLTPRNAFITTLSYLILGLAGLPVFAGFKGGLQAILLPSFGFILAWIPATTIQAWFLAKTDSIVWSNVLNYILTYSIGLVYMGFIMSSGLENFMAISDILWIGLLPFIPGDIIKIVIATLIIKKLRDYRQKKSRPSL